VDLSPSAIKSVSRELYALERTPPDDIQIIINETNLADVQAWIRGPGNLFLSYRLSHIRFQQPCD
jgi:hypothetical protein